MLATAFRQPVASRCFERAAVVSGFRTESICSQPEGPCVKISHREGAHLRTSGGLSVTDITDEVRDAVLKLGISDGICCIYSPHMSCAVRVNEWERGFFEDFAVMLKRLMPSDLYHGDWDRRLASHFDAARSDGRVRACARRGVVPRRLAANSVARARRRTRGRLAR
jgi:hypothetical protein